MKIFHKIFFTFLLILELLILDTSHNVGSDANTPDPLCGPKSLMKVCELRGIDTNLKEICNFSGYNKSAGTTMFGLYKASLEKGLTPVSIKTNIEHLCDKAIPGIAFVDGNHFTLVLEGIDNCVLLQDPPKAPFLQTKQEFCSRWNGEILSFSESLIKENHTEKSQLKSQIIGPHIYFEKQIHHFGEVNEGDTLSCRFVFKNVGTDILKVILRSTCSCSIANISDTVTSPGSKNEIAVQFDTHGKKGLTKQVIYVKSNDPENSLSKLIVSAVVRQTVKSIPENIWLDKVVREQSISREIQIIKPKDRLFNIIDIDTPKGISAVLQPKKNNSEAVYLSLNINVGCNLGKFEKQIIISTDDNKKPVISIPVSGIVISEIKAHPPKIFYGELPPDTTVVKKVKISSRLAKSINLIHTNKSNSYLTTELNPIDSENYQLTAVLRTPQENVTIRDQIDIFQEGNTKPLLKIPIYAKILSKY